MEETRTMKLLPAEDRPYEKCLQSGPGALTDAELLAVMLRTGTTGRTALELAADILSLCPFSNGLTGIFHLTADQLCALRGVGQAKAVLFFIMVAVIAVIQNKITTSKEVER